MEQQEADDGLELTEGKEQPEEEAELKTSGNEGPEEVEEEEWEAVQERNEEKEEEKAAEEEAKDAGAAVPAPIPKRKDRGVWPNLYDECQSLLSSSILMYAVATARVAIRKGEVDDPVVSDFLMNFPLESKKTVPIILERKELFAKFLGDEGTKDEDGNVTYPYLDMVMAKRETPLQQKMSKKASDTSPNPDPEGDDMNALLSAHTDDLDSELVLVEIHDKKPTEIVYGITVNHQRERIEISFRGSVTTRDWIVDVDPLMDFFPNPVESVKGYPQKKTIGIHAGFADYMKGRHKKLYDGKSKMIIESVIALQKKYPHYRIYTTGHSLGGALAVLTAFVLATTEGIHKPVTCVSVASPMVGNIDFRNAFQALEKTGHVRHARVTNRLDVIPFMPTRVCWCCDVCCCCVSWLFAACQSRRYWQVGAHVLLYADGTCEVSYERDTMSYCDRMENEFSARGLGCRFCTRLCCSGGFGHGEGDVLKNHSCQEYMRRMNAAEDELKGKHLQHLYFLQSRHSINTKGVVPPAIPDSAQQEQNT